MTMHIRSRSRCASAAGEIVRAAIGRDRDQKPCAPFAPESWTRGLHQCFELFNRPIEIAIAQFQDVCLEESVNSLVMSRHQIQWAESPLSYEMPGDLF